MTKKNKIKIIDQWDDIFGSGDRYMELRVDAGGACCVKQIPNGIYIYKFEGKEVYSFVGGADYPLRNLTESEKKKVIAFAKEQFDNVECIIENNN